MTLTFYFIFCMTFTEKTKQQRQIRCSWIFRLLWCSGVFRGVPGCSGVFWGVLGCSGVFWGVLGCSGGVLGCSGVFWGVLGCSGVFWGVLGCSGVFWGVLGCSGVFWGVLGCSGVFWGFPGCSGGVPVFLVLVHALYFLLLNGRSDIQASLWVLITTSTLGTRNPPLS